MAVTVKSYSVGILSNNTYLVYGDGMDAVVVDAAGGYQRISQDAATLGKKVTAVLLTHGHWDHIAECALWRQSGAKVYIMAEDAGMLTGEESLAGFFMQNIVPSKADVLLQGGQVVQVGDLVFDVIATPGHSKGGAVFKIDKYLFTGDTLFAGDIGRYDLPGGNKQTLVKSIEGLFDLAGDYIVLPGHEQQTTLSNERRSNMVLCLTERKW